MSTYAIKIDRADGSIETVLDGISAARAYRVANDIRHTVRMNERMFIETPNGFDVIQRKIAR